MRYNEESLIYTTYLSMDLYDRLKMNAKKFEWADGWTTLISGNNVSVYGHYKPLADLNTLNNLIIEAEDQIKKLNYILKDVKDVINRRTIR